MSQPLSWTQDDMGQQDPETEAATRRQLPDGLFTVYQPFVNLATGQVQGYEAFIRRGTAAAVDRPASFLPGASQSDLICELDAWVLKIALAQLASWHDATGSQDLILATNLAARHVLQPRVVKDVVTALQNANVQADRLLLDISEISLLADPDASGHLGTLRALGVCICLDSSELVGRDPASALRDSPTDVVKLNPGFLDSTLTSRRAVAEFVGDVQDCGLPIVAGGIETAEQFDFARSIGCEWAQGFLLGEPRPAGQITPDRRITP
ncbi:MAG TPA: EAL domain-containing protein [Dermatophilaceae bacterium]|nr:EAL domain-containing protein [Dermatophilaceae bacterium]